MNKIDAIKLVFLSGCVAALPFATPALAKREATPQVSAAEIESLRACRSIVEVGARAACYDAATEKLLAATDGRKLVILDRQEVQKTRRSLFGFSLPRIAFLESGDGDDRADRRSLDARIASVSRSGYGKFRFRIVDGGVWETTDLSSRPMDLRVGDAVVLEKGALGGYFLVLGRERIGARRLPEPN